jgi:hypothetical protein
MNKVDKPPMQQFWVFAKVSWYGILYPHSVIKALLVSYGFDLNFVIQVIK